MVVPNDASRSSRARASSNSSSSDSRAQIAHRGVDAAAAPRDLHVVEPRGAHLLLLVARAAEDACVCESTNPGVSTPLPQSISVARGIPRAQRSRDVDRDDPPPSDGDGDAGANAGVAHLRAAPRARRAGAGDDLRRIDEDESAADRVAHAITSRTRDSRSGACASPRHA